jgi:nicotinamidase-related amidase
VRRMSDGKTNTGEGSYAQVSAGATALFVCDIQERFRTLISGMPDVIQTSAFLVQVAKVLNLPIFVTLQYPKVFGQTVEEIDLSSVPPENIVSKTIFSMMTPEFEQVFKAAAPDTKNIILVGIEAHVCVLQTCHDLIKKGYNVYVVCDGVSSQRIYDRTVALHQLQSIGVRLTTAESLVFQMMGSAKFEHFKTISGLIKDRKISQDFPFGHSTL